MTREQVLRQRGVPPADGGFGSVSNYGDLVVVFRKDRAVQVLGSPLELDGRPLWKAGAPPEALLQELHEQDYYLQLDVLDLSGGPLALRLLPEPIREPFPAATPLLRNRISQQLDRLEGSRAVSFDLQCAETNDLSLCEDWLEGTCRALRWKPLALRRALWECLHLGQSYWQAGGRVRPTGHIVSTNSWVKEPTHVRLRLLVDSEIRLARRRGVVAPAKIALDEMDEAECAAAWHRLMLLGNSPAAGYWRGYRGESTLHIRARISACWRGALPLPLSQACRSWVSPTTRAGHPGKRGQAQALKEPLVRT